MASSKRLDISYIYSHDWRMKEENYCCPINYSIILCCFNIICSFFIAYKSTIISFYSVNTYVAVGCLAWRSLIQEFAYKQFLIVNSLLYLGFRWHIFQVLCTNCLSVKSSLLPRSPSAFRNEYLIWQIIQYLTGYLCCGNLCKPVPVPCFSSFAHLLFCFSSWTQTSSSTAV